MTDNTINNGQINFRCGIVAWGRYGNSASSRLDDQHFEVVLQPGRHRRRARRPSRADKSPGPPVVPIVFWGKRICQRREMNTLKGLLPSLEPDEGSATMSKVKTRLRYRLRYHNRRISLIVTKTGGKGINSRTAVNLGEVFREVIRA